MGHKERIFHMVLFEFLALIMLTLVAVLATGKDALSMGGLAVILSLVAMVWNYIYNWVFDHLCASPRHLRSKTQRIFHGLWFELGMMILSFPIIMWVMDMSLLNVLIMDIGLVLFFFVYTVLFNWAYDMLKLRWFGAPA